MRVVRERAERLAGSVSVDIVTARAVAPLDRLAAWTLPLLGADGRLLAMKGKSAPEEIRASGAALRRLGAGTPELVMRGEGIASEPTRVVIVPRTRVAQG